jgi:mucin-19
VAGVASATYNVPATGSCVINYQVCAPAPNTTVCDTATLTVVAILVPVPDLALTKTSTSTFTVGSNASFTLTPNNLQGAAPTSGTVTVTDTLPTGLTYVAAGSGGTGWTCGVLAQVVTCTSNAVIAAGATGTAITINVVISSTAVPSVTNVASVGGGGEPPANTGNNSALLTVPVGNAPVNTFTTDGAQTGLPGTSVFYPHTFNAGSAGTVSFAATQAPNPNIAGWVTTIFRDANCNGTLDGADGTTPLTGTTAVNPGDQVCIIVRNDIPAAAPFNAQDVLTTTATFTPSTGSAINYTRQDVTTVVLNGGLTLTKSVRNITQGGTVGTNNTAKPGDILEYIVTYTNTANAPVSMIVVTDTTPVFTTFVSAVCNTPLPAALTGCSFTAPTVGASGNVVWTLNGALNASQSGTVAFRVTVQ